MRYQYPLERALEDKRGQNEMEFGSVYTPDSS